LPLVFLPKRLYRILKLFSLRKRRDLLLPVDPEVMRTVKSGQTTKMSGMWMLMLEIWSDQGRLDLFLHLLFSGNPKLLQT
jgi:hypothetical protein